jgi:hypothetical protein
MVNFQIADLPKVNQILLITLCSWLSLGQVDLLEVDHFYRYQIFILEFLIQKMNYYTNFTLAFFVVHRSVEDVLQHLFVVATFGERKLHHR